MREIKLRAWDQVSRKWLWITGFETKETSESNGYSLGGLFHNGDYVGHKNITVVQYTGLKDKNGCEIYEGDIVRQFPREGYGHIILNGNLGIIEFGHSAFVSKNVNDHRTHFLFYTEQEVIGNIYENPELLEGDSN